MAFCSVSELKERYDERRVDQLSNDQNSTLPDTSRIQAALDDADAEIRAAARQGGFYTSTELDNLVSGGDTLLVRLCADGAMRHLARRRGFGRVEGLESAFERYQEMLDKLRKGTRVLNIDSVRDADTPEIVTLTADEKENLESLTSTEFFEGGRDTPTA